MAANPEGRHIVYLVGAGPGRVDLITLRGAELIKSADCIIYDKLANPELLIGVRPEAEVIHVPKRTGGKSFTQDQINELLVEKAGQHQRVVRLKGGDPCIFGRCSEEALALSEAGFAFEIVPGITAGIAAAEYTGILLTDRLYSSQVVFITGREADGKGQSNIDWEWLARFPGTIVFYMGVGTLGTIVENLKANGMEASMPCAVICNATFPTQRLVKAPLEHIEATCRDKHVEPPAIIVIGRAADSDPRLNWFMDRPLFGRTIVITRDVRGNSESATAIAERGGNPVCFTTFGIQPLTDRKVFLEAMARFSDYEWVIFTSRNGVEVFFDVLAGLRQDGRALAGKKIGVIGSQTAEALTQFGIRADFVPTTYTGRELGRQLLASYDLAGKKMLLLRSELASDDLPAILSGGEARVDDVPLYTAAQNRDDSAAMIEQLEAGAVDWITFASPSSAESFFDQIPNDAVTGSTARVAAIGPVTAKRLAELGVKVDLIPERYTAEGLLDAIEDTYR